MHPGFRRIFIPIMLLFILTGVSTIHSTQGAGAASNFGVRWAFYITYNPNSWDSLQANASNLNYVSPWFYTINAMGAVTGRDQPQVGSLLRRVGAMNLPLLKNTPTYNDFSAILGDPNKQQIIVNSIDAFISSYNYDGITIDFEGLNPSDKANLSAFMGLLYARLHPQGKLVAMAIAPKTREVNTGWAAAYDYSALAAVSDYLIIMAYDYHYAGGDPGPIAPIDKLRLTADYAISQIPANKIVWGIGVYGYDWGVDDTGRSTGPAEYRTFSEADALAQSNEAQSGYDQASESPWVFYTRDGAQREVWYENARSFRAKLDLVSEYGMAGFGIWRLGQEDPRVWGLIGGGGSTPSPVATPTATFTPTPSPTPTAPPKPAACLPVQPFASTADKLFFPQTGHSLGGVFLAYWQANGGLAAYGYPITEEFIETSKTDGKPYTVQYFERNRFELHPENQPPNDVQLGLLGAQAVGLRVFPPAADLTPGADIVFFPQVQHTLSNAFLAYWQAHGGLAQFGYPISEPVMEKSAINGKTYLVQYLERARFELHPEYKGSDAEVLLGLLGLDVTPCK